MNVRRSFGICLLVGLVAAGCGDDEPTDGDGPTGGATASGPVTGDLAVIHEPDPALAAEGLAAFSEGQLVQGVIPPDAMRHLYITWSNNLLDFATYYGDSNAYWAAFNERYGTVPSPFEGATYPAGFGVGQNGQVGIDCLLCHAGRLEGSGVAQTVIGLSNNRLDLRAFVEDLQALPAAIESLKQQNLPEPYAGLVAALPDAVIPEPYASLDVPTAAAGANDGFGLGLLTSTYHAEPPPELRTFMGYEDAPAWWTIRNKERLYTDGSAPADGIYTMMSTLLAFGLTLPELAAYVPTFQAMRHTLCDLRPPRWDDFGMPPIDTSLIERGSDVFRQQCASCHGAHDGDAFPNTLVTPAEIGTDPFRVDQFGEVEAAWFNSFIPTQEGKMTSTDGYLAPPLEGIWASAPYLHNGSVPTLRALLVPSERPTLWRRSAPSIDPINLGLTYETVDAAPNLDTVEGRKVVDTTQLAMGNTGHVFDLPEEDVAALLELLKTF